MARSNLKYLAFALAFTAPPTLVVAAAVGFGTHIRGDCAAAPEGSQTASIDLGRIICGDCCVGNVWGAIGELPGVRDIDIKPGQKTFTVFYDSALINPEQVVARLIASGESGASIGTAVPETAGEHDGKRWVRTAKR